MRGAETLPGTYLSARLLSALEATWLVLIFLLPVYFNPFGYQVFYFAKALLLQFGVSLLLGLFIARWFISIKDRRNINLLSIVRQFPLQFAVILFGLCWLVSTALSIMPDASLWGSLARKNGLVSTVAWIIFFLILSLSIQKRSQLYRVLITLVFSAAFVSLFGILEFADPWLLSWLSRNGRISSTDGNPLSLSCFISINIPITLALIAVVREGPDSRRWKSAKTIGLLTAFVLEVVCLVLAQYAITILLFIPGIFIFLLAAGVRFNKKSILAISITVLLVLLMAAIFIVGQTLLSDTNSSPAVPSQESSVAGKTGLNTLVLRVSEWKSAVTTITDSPEVPFYQDTLHGLRKWVGYGPETFAIVSQVRYPINMKSSDTFNSVLLGQPENHYLYLATTIGLLGLASFLAIVIIFFYLSLKVLYEVKQRDMILLTASFVAGMAQYCIYILFNPTAILPDLLFWLLLSLVVVLFNQERGNKETSPDLTSHISDNKWSPLKSNRKSISNLIAVLIVMVFIFVGFGLTLSPMLADMRLNSALSTWSDDSKTTMSTLAEVVKLEPGEATYYGHIGAYAFRLAISSNDRVETSELMALSVAAYETAGKLEPYLSYWSYTTGDMYTYWAGHANADKWQDAYDCYQRANALYPDNAVILNKWALAAMLGGNYAEAQRLLKESREADGEWIQTTYYMGVLDTYQRCHCSAANCFIFPIKLDYRNYAYYMDVCRNLALYGGLDKVVEGLQVYDSCHPDDWLGKALLGTAKVYERRLPDAADSFQQAAGNITSDEAAILRDMLTNLGREQESFRPYVEKLLSALGGS